MTLRCKQGDLCVIVDGPTEDVNLLLGPIKGFIVTVTSTCPEANDRSWHYKGEQLVIEHGVYHRYAVHAIPDSNLQPIRGATPSKATENWSPKKQTLLTR